MTPRIVRPSLLKRLLSAEARRPFVSDIPPETFSGYDSPFMRLLVSADRGKLSQSFTERHCTPGEIVIQEGEPGDTMYLIWSGRVAILKGDLESPTILDFRGAGDIIGEMAILESQPRSASVVAIEPLRILGIDRQSFERLLRETPSVSLGIMETLSARLRRSDETISTGELSEKRLSQQISTLQSEKQRLEELQRLRQETTELIIHDLRNPLSAIALALRMLTLELPEEVLQGNREMLEAAQASCERMQRLVDSLLEVSRLEAGQIRLTMSTVDLGKMIEEVVDKAAIFLRRGTTLQAHIAPDLPLLNLDQEKIERVLFNLLDNAMNYTPENGRITIAAEREPGESVRVSVSDTGPGIPEEERQHVFERFAQATGDKAVRRGFGLGLTYCRLAVELHGGRIWVESGEGGQGSRFIFTLPIASTKP